MAGAWLDDLQLSLAFSFYSSYLSSLVILFTEGRGGRESGWEEEASFQPLFPLPPSSFSSSLLTFFPPAPLYWLLLLSSYVLLTTGAVSLSIPHSVRGGEGGGRLWPSYFLPAAARHYVLCTVNAGK